MYKNQQPEYKYTFSDFVRDLGTADARNAEDAGVQLIALAATSSPADLIQMSSELERRGARARSVREWTTTVRAQSKANARTVAAAERDARASNGPNGLKGGALIGWLADQLRTEVGGFACDPGGALYRYEKANGRYVGPCEDWIGARVRAILDERGALELFGKSRVDAVAFDLRTTATDLWHSPPKDRLCVLNGVLDLASGELEPHRPGLWLSTLGLPITYDPGAGAHAPAWRDYFASVLPADAPPGWGFELVRWLLTPASGKRPAVLLYGPGDDGKSTFLGLLSDVLGGATGSSVSAVPLQVLSSDRFAQADLFGSVLNVCADLPDEPLVGADIFKRITGGDLIRAERKYGHGFNFSPHAHLLFSSNHPIRLKTAMQDRAFWGRWLVVPFRANFSEGSSIRLSIGALRESLLAPAALSSLLNAALSCSADGGPPAPSRSMEEALDTMRRGIRPASVLPAGHGDGATSNASGSPLVSVAPSVAHNFSNAREKDTP
jgi:P4 family phage/plasmid primase-like protien